MRGCAPAAGRRLACFVRAPVLDRSHNRSICCFGRLSSLDTPSLMRLHTDIEVRRFLGGPVEVRIARLRVQSLVQTNRPLPIWAIRDANSIQSPLLGVVSLDRHHDGNDTEVSFALLPEYRGRGFATEAVQFALRHAFGRMGLARIVAETQSLNARSVALLERIGMVFQRTVIRFGAEQSIYAAHNPNLPAAP
jgi:[ribosomal protein S5]-alanine N-acetyltransferase